MAALQTKERLCEMVRTVIAQGTFEVETHLQYTPESDMRLLSHKRDMLASDAFDLHAQSIGYFRFAVQTNAIYKVSVCVLNNGQCVEETEITRD